MKTFSSLKQNKIAFSLSVIVAVFFVVSVASAVTTITTNIVTAGNISTTAGTLTVGSNGTAISEILKGTCVLTNYGTPGQGIDANHAATSTVLYQCAATSGGTAITGVASGDLTIVQFATSTPGLLNGFAIVGSTASTTNGYINVLVTNLTGQAKIPSTLGVGSSTSYIIMR